MSVKKTNNDVNFLESKILLREQSLPKQKDIKVLEAFGGEGILWGMVAKRNPDLNIKVLSIDKNKYKRVQLQGDNLKFLQAFDLNEFDIIDLDAWGSPVNQLEILFKKHYTGIVHCTFIQTMHGGVPKTLLRRLGYSDAMLSKVSSIFFKNGVEKLKNYLALNGIRTIHIISSNNNKNYLWFSLKK